MSLEKYFQLHAWLPEHELEQREIEEKHKGRELFLI
jgi:hypothetical protein